MQEQEVYFNDVKAEIDTAKTEIKSKAITTKKEMNRTTVVLSDVENKLDCTKDEIFLNLNARNTKKRIVKRGEVYNCNLGFGVGSEMRKIRPCVVLSDNVTNFHSPNIIIAPVTHTHKSLNSFVQIKYQKDNNNNIILDGSVNVADIRTVSKARLGNYITILPNTDLKNINERIFDILGVMPIVKGLRNTITTKEEQLKIIKSKNNNLEEIYSLTGTTNMEELKYFLKKCSQNTQEN